ncbi:MAG: EAL domain-containing protein [Candidatus Thiodiazotropha sp.]
MRLRNRIVLTLAGLFACHFLVQGYLDYRDIGNELKLKLQSQAASIRTALSLGQTDSTLRPLPLPEAIDGIDVQLQRPGVRDGGGQEVETELDYFVTHPSTTFRLRRVESPDGKDYYRYTAPIAAATAGNQASPHSLLEIRFPAQQAEADAIADFEHRLLVHGVGILLVFIITAWLIDRILLIPIGRLKQVVSRLAGDDTQLNARLREDRDLEQVSRRFEQMAGIIQQREQALNRQKGLFALLSQTNKIIIRDVEPRQLFKRFCEIAVTYGEFVAAWIGEVDSARQQVRPVASSHVNRLDKRSSITLRSDSPPGMAVFGGRPVFIDQIDWDQGELDWCQPVTPRIGQSAAVLPILRKGQVLGLLTVYAESSDYFDQIVQDLLDEVVGDIAFAIVNHTRNQAHKAAHKQLAHSSRRLAKVNHQMRLLLESTGEGIFGVDQKGDCTFINQAAASMLGYKQDEVLSQPIHRMIRMPELAQRAFSAGMQQQVPRRVKDESFRRFDGTLFPVEYSTHPMIEEGRVKGAVTVFRDVTETRSMLREMRFLASHDPLTHLYNRHAFDQRLRQAFAEARDYGLTHVLFYMDLDQFKLVNDTCGHVAGDTMLRHLAHQLRQAIGAGGVLARLGGDEFGLLLERTSLEQGQQVAGQIFETIKRFRFSWEGRSFSCGVSIGIAGIDANTESTHSVLSAADTACYVAKDMGRNRMHVYRPYDEEITRQQGQMRWVNRIETAIQQESFSLMQQPILSIGSHAIGDEHVEVLLRMHDSEGGVIAPGAFIPAAERYNLMGGLDRWVIRNTFRWLAEHPDRLEELGLCAINLSGQSLGEGALYEYILEQLREFQLPAQKISFEITETAVVSRLDQATRFISLLRRRGFRFALDDFGTGMSSFAYLKSLPVDFLKIDGSFVRNMLNDPVDRAMVESINRIGHLMGLKTIAEYVESDQILEQLIDLGVDYAQGFGIMEPTPLVAVGSGPSGVA